jgi:hypothetical protein
MHSCVNGRMRRAPLNHLSDGIMEPPRRNLKCRVTEKAGYPACRPPARWPRRCNAATVTIRLTLAGSFGCWLDVD